MSELVVSEMSDEASAASPTVEELQSMRVVELRGKLTEFGLPTNGIKADLVQVGRWGFVLNICCSYLLFLEIVRLLSRSGS